MDFQEKMVKYAKYGISVRTSYNEGVDYYMVSLTFGNRWKVMQTAENPEAKVMCAKVNNDGTYCYMTQVCNGLTPVFDLIDETINYNDELEKKVELLKVKAEELKEIFAEKSYDELLFLKFVIETPQEPVAKKNKRQPKSGKKTPQKPNTEHLETIPDNVTTQEVPTQTETQNELIVEQVSESSDIDRKIAEALGNNI